MVCLYPLRGCQDWIRQARNLLRENIIREKKWSELKKKWGVPVDYTADLTLVQERAKEGRTG